MRSPYRGGRCVDDARERRRNRRSDLRTRLLGANGEGERGAHLRLVEGDDDLGKDESPGAKRLPGRVVVGGAGIEAGAAEEARARERIERSGAQLVRCLAQRGCGGGEGRAGGGAQVEGAAEPEEVQVVGGLLPGDRGGRAKLARVPTGHISEQLGGKGDGGETGAVFHGAQAQQLGGKVEGRSTQRGRSRSQSREPLSSLRIALRRIPR